VGTGSAGKPEDAGEVVVEPGERFGCQVADGGTLETATVKKAGMVDQGSGRRVEARLLC
jgi:hypothetical protein